MDTILLNFYSTEQERTITVSYSKPENTIRTTTIYTTILYLSLSVHL